MNRISAIARLSLTTHDAAGLATFYQRALGFRLRDKRRYETEACIAEMGVPSTATALWLDLGTETIELVQFDQPGRPYPSHVQSNDPIFQHFAIVVSDMDTAYRRLTGVAGWHAITRDGPQVLPENTGRVSAFKFRDPEGHPLELIAFPSGRTPPHWQSAARNDVCLGVDHTAIAVADTRRSIAFYEGLGFAVAGGSLNRGPEQDRLDDVPDPIVAVTPLNPPGQAPHLELLCYQSPTIIAGPFVANNAVAATRIVLLADQPEATTGLTLDPDGHRLTLITAPPQQAPVHPPVSQSPRQSR